MQLNQRCFLLDDEQSWFMDQHFMLYQFVPQYIEDGHEVVLRDCFCYERCIMQYSDTYYEKFPWKQTLIQQPLEGEAIYIGKGQIVFSKQVPGLFVSNFCHPYY